MDLEPCSSSCYKLRSLVGYGVDADLLLPPWAHRSIPQYRRPTPLYCHRPHMQASALLSRVNLTKPTATPGRGALVDALSLASASQLASNQIRIFPNEEWSRAGISKVMNTRLTDLQKGSHKHLKLI